MFKKKKKKSKKEREAGIRGCGTQIAPSDYHLRYICPVSRRHPGGQEGTCQTVPPRLQHRSRNVALLRPLVLRMDITYFPKTGGRTGWFGP